MTSAAVLVERAQLLDLPAPPPPCRKPHKFDKDCADCYRRHKWLNVSRRRALELGVWEGLVDAAPAVEHMRALRAAGKSYKQQAREVGVDTSILWTYLSGQYTRMHSTTRSAILALQPPPPELATGRGDLVHACGTRRRLDDLALRRFSGRYLADLFGITPQSVNQWGRGKLVVTVQVAERVKELHADLEGQTGPSAIAAQRAKARGALPLRVWGDRVDDPTAEPNLNARPPDGPVTIQEPEGYVLWGGGVLIDPASIRSAINEDVPTPPLTAAEEIEVVRAGSITPWPGLSSMQLAGRIGTYQRRVVRIRSALAYARQALLGVNPIPEEDRGRYTDWLIYVASLPAPHGVPTPLPKVAALLDQPLKRVERRRRQILTTRLDPRIGREVKRR